MPALSEWFSIRFDDRSIDVHASPPSGAAWEARLVWEHIIRVCFKSGGWSEPDEIYIFTDERPERYLIPTEADGGGALWTEILERKLFDAGMAIEAASATNELFCSPLRGRDIEAKAFPLYSPRQLPELEGDALILTWDQRESDSVIRHGALTVWQERTGWEVYDRFEDIAAMLKYKYGNRLPE